MMPHRNHCFLQNAVRKPAKSCAPRMDRKAFAACTEAICSNLHQTAVLYFDSEAAAQSLCRVVCRICWSLTAITDFFFAICCVHCKQRCSHDGTAPFWTCKASEQAIAKGKRFAILLQLIIEQNYSFVQSRGGRRNFAENFHCGTNQGTLRAQSRYCIRRYTIDVD